MGEKTYLADGCYASFDGNGIELTTENGIETTNRVYLEQTTYGALVMFHDRVTGKTTNRTVNMPLAPIAAAGCNASPGLTQVFVTPASEPNGNGEVPK